MEYKELEFLVESNAIEGETSTPAFTDAVRAWSYAKKHANDMSLYNLLQIHYLLMRRIDPEIAGKIRTCRIAVGKEECMAPELVQPHLSSWIDSFYKQESWESIRNAHIQFLRIHPFYDGNGRTSRILMNLQRVNMGMEPLVIHHGKEQQEYYEWFD